MILVDPAIWRWRGRRWAHLVSDTSHEELHAFAARLGLRRIWFQGDHYDIPTEIREEALLLGAVAVDSRELVLRLSAAGLRKRRTKSPLVSSSAEAQSAESAGSAVGAGAAVGEVPDMDTSGPGGNRPRTSERSRYAPGVPAWIDLVTTDPDGAMEFYGAVLGWDFDIGGPETGRYTYCRVRGLAVAGLNGQPAPPGMSPSWTTYLAENDVDSAAARITAAGGAIVVGPVDAGPAGRVVVANDPVGAQFGLWQAKEHIGAELVDEPGAPTWTELHTADAESATAFYTAVCGYAWESADRRPSDSSYRTFHVNGRPAGGLRVVPGQSGSAARSRWVPYIAVLDADATAATAEAAGGTVDAPPKDSPFGRWAAIADPQGARLTVVAVPGLATA